MYMPNNSWKTRGIVIPSQMAIAPMAGISNPAFRVTCEEFGAGLICTGMASDGALYCDNEKTVGATDAEEQEYPLAIQIFGYDIRIVVYTAKFLDEKTNCGIIDINMRCPVTKIVKPFTGGVLIKDADHAVEASRVVVQSMKKPVIVKMWIGWDMDQIACLELTRGLEPVGMQALATYGRARKQMYEGCVDWSYTKEVKEVVSTPVTGNRDVRSGEDVEGILRETGYDAVMIGRGALKDPWLVKDTARYLKCGKHTPEVTLEEMLAMARLHAEHLRNLKGEFVGIREMYEHVVWYMKRLPKSHQFKDQLNKIETYREMQSILSVYEIEYARIQEQYKQGNH